MIEALAIGLLIGGFIGWFLRSYARRQKLWVHKWNRARQFESARRELMK